MVLQSFVSVVTIADPDAVDSRQEIKEVVASDIAVGNWFPLIVVDASSFGRTGFAPLFDGRYFDATVF